MATTTIPAVIDALVALATEELDNVKVYDGFGISDDPGDFLMVGVEDPDTQGFTTSASTRQEWHESGQSGQRDDIGDVTCCALSWNGDGDQKAARDAVFTNLAALEAAIRSNYTLGIDEVLWADFGSQVELHQVQDDAGAVAWVIFRVQYQALI